ncbi:MAG: ABC transporter permease [Blastocatellia bacterium]|nr:ABC transporter permease [Blastocatellia bacterium]
MERDRMSVKGLFCGLLILGTMSGAALFADFLSPYSPTRQHRAFPSMPPTGWNAVAAAGETTRVRYLVAGDEYLLFGLIPAQTHLFGAEEPGRVFLLGTDSLGRDLWSRLLHGAQQSLGIAAVSLLIALPLALAIGGAAGYYGGTFDFAVMRAIELFLALPALYLIIALRTALPLDLEPKRVFLAMVAVIAFFGWAHLARLVRGLALSLRAREFVMAAIATGAGDWRILTKHMLPHLQGFSLTQAALMAPGFILAEVTLSYLGLGVPEPLPSWGSMLSSATSTPALTLHWWNLAPIGAVFLVTFSFQLIADGLKRRFESPDPEAGVDRTPDRIPL